MTATVFPVGNKIAVLSNLRTSKNLLLRATTTNLAKPECYKREAYVQDTQFETVPTWNFSSASQWQISGVNLNFPKVQGHFSFRFLFYITENIGQ